MKGRTTIQKIKILDFLNGVHTHPTAEMVYEGVKKELPTISLGTVYRNLNLMSESGDIVRIEVNGEYRFDGDMSKHQHCVCTSCSQIFDIFNPKINDYAIKNFSLDNFDVDLVQVLFRGTCNDCK